MKFNYLILGTKGKKEENGFGQGGDWLLLKCFYQDKEFYLNLNEKTGEGEIVRKDEELILEITK